MPARKIEPPATPQKLSKYEQGYNDGYQTAKNEFNTTLCNWRKNTKNL